MDRSASGKGVDLPPHHSTIPDREAESAPRKFGAESGDMRRGLASSRESGTERLLSKKGAQCFCCNPQFPSYRAGHRFKDPKANVDIHRGGRNRGPGVVQKASSPRSEFNRVARPSPTSTREGLSHTRGFGSWVDISGGGLNLMSRVKRELSLSEMSSLT